MIIRLERSGGFMGIPLRAEIDTLKLPAGEGDALRQQVEAARFFDLPEKIAENTKGADRFQYALTVEDAGRRHSVSVGEADAPPELQNLIQHVTQLARSKR
jgi:hypothetical protein